MIHYIKRISNHTKDYLIQNRFLFLKIVCMLIVVFLTTGFSVNTVQAASGLRIYNYATKKNSVYSDKQILVSYNGSMIGRTQTPGILVDGVALVPYNDIFEKSGIDADCIYNKNMGTVSISKNGVTILMTIGSKKATVNGKTVILAVAPIKIKYRDIDLAKVLVPSRFVSETLGLGYIWNSAKSTVSIKKYTMLLSYNSGKKFEYTGIQGSVTIDNKKVELGDMPSVILNNTAMLRAEKVFTDSKFGAQYEFNKENKTVTLSKDGNVLVMTVGSTIAYLNGKPSVLDTAPIIVTNYDRENSYVMVPGGFTAACLGFDYSWNNAKKTSMITSRKEETTSNGTGNSNTDPELGDSGVIIETGTILNRWQGIDSLFGKSSEMHELNIGAASMANPGSIISVSRDYNNIKQNSETFMLFGSTPFGKITASQSGKTITIHAAGIKSTDQTYQMFGVTSNLVNTIGTYNNAEDNSTTIELNVLPENYLYDLSLSMDKQILYVTVYQNTVTSSVIGVNSTGDYITLGGLSPLDITITTTIGFVYIDIPYTTNSLGDLFTDVIGANYIKGYYSVSYPNKTQFILALNEGYEQYISENGNQYTISFQKPGAIVQPAQPEIPEVIDISKYEIVIPKPEGITSTMISHEDYYFNHSFVIKIPGDFTEYFNNHAITHNSIVIENLSITLNNNNETEIRIATSRLQGYALASDSENIYVNIGEPRDIYKNIVVLDPGHGGPAKGANYFNTFEKDVNFKILYTIGKNYFNSDTSKLKVYYTRISDVDMTLKDRAAFAAKYDADLFVSLHMNASLSATPCGTEVFYSDNNNKANSAGLTSRSMAAMFVNNIASALGTSNRGVKQEMYTVVHRNTVPAVLIELGFLSNQNEFNKLTDQTFQENTAKTIYETLLQVFEAYPTGR